MSFYVLMKFCHKAAVCVAFTAFRAVTSGDLKNNNYFLIFHNLRKVFAAERKFTKFGGKKPPATQTLSFTPF